jgi:hypothetical protein
MARSILSPVLNPLARRVRRRARVDRASRGDRCVVDRVAQGAGRARLGEAVMGGDRGGGVELDGIPSRTRCTRQPVGVTFSTCVLALGGELVQPEIGLCWTRNR